MCIQFILVSRREFCDVHLPSTSTGQTEERASRPLPDSQEEELTQQPEALYTVPLPSPFARMLKTGSERRSDVGHSSSEIQAESSQSTERGIHRLDSRQDVDAELWADVEIHQQTTSP